MTRKEDTSPHSIYVLIDSRDNEIRYVGQTTKTLEKRLSAHLRTKEKNHRGNWIREVLRDGGKPIIVEIDVVPAGENWQYWERFWIATYKGWGCDLVNQTDGGEGAAGRIWTEEQREKHGRNQLGRKHIEETRANMSKTRKGRKHTSEAKANMSTSAKGKPSTLGSFKEGYTHTEETKIKMQEYHQRRCGKRIALYNIHRVFIKFFLSIGEASRELNIHRVYVWRALQKEGIELQGYYFEYADE